jgi:hypothetical protein
MEVVGTNEGRYGDSIRVRNEEGLEWVISKNIIDNEMYSAGQYGETVVLSRTELVEKLEGAGDTIFTVVFDKKASAGSVMSTLDDLDGLPNTKYQLKQLAKNLLVGDRRTLVGYLASTEPKMGRSTVVDLEIASDKHRLRLVDHRTINSLIIRNVRYVLK